MNAVRQLLIRLRTGAPLSGDDIIALLLLLAMVASLAHLTTMIITRWGDRNVAFKSLLASVLIHLVCILGLEVFDPLAARAARRDHREPDGQPLQAEVLVESDTEVPLVRSGNVPIADRPVPPEIEIQRFSDAVPEIDRLRPEEPQPAPESPRVADVRDVNQAQEQPVNEAALPADAGRQAPTRPAAEDPGAEIRTTRNPSQADVYTANPERTRPRQGPPERDIPEPDLPAADGGAPSLDTETRPADVSLQALSPDDSSVSVPPADIAMNSKIRRPSAPVTSLDDDSRIGRSDAPERTTGPAASFRSRLPTPSRSPSEPNARLRETIPNSLRAQTPTPLASDYDDVRIGTLGSDLSPALTSGGPITEPELPLIRRRDSPPATYQLRDVAQRREAAARFGGTRESEAAVELSLRWLASRQKRDGRWDAEEHGAGQVEIDEQGVDRNFAGRDADTGLTALATLCFLGAGYTHEGGRYAVEVDHALDWLIRQQGDDGNLCGDARYYARMYCHAMATYALAEAWGMQKETLLGPIIEPEIVAAGQHTAHDVAALTIATATAQPLCVLPFHDDLTTVLSWRIATGLRRVDDLRLRSALSRAVTFTISQQDAVSGGWRYRTAQEGDVSMFGWHMMSLKSAEIAGIAIDDRIRTRMRSFLDSVRQGRHGGLYGYRRNVLSNGRNTEPVTPVMTAEALFCRQMLGYSPTSEASRESVAYLLNNMPRLAELNYYYWYYGTLAMYQYGGRPWEQWNSIVRDTLIAEQRRDGPLAGSWDPNDPWGRYGGRLYSTALATLTLEVYYRLLPLYRLNDDSLPRDATNPSR